MIIHNFINLLGDTYVVWNKSAEVFSKRLTKEHLYADFKYTTAELEEIKNKVQQKGETDIVKITMLTSKD